MDVREYQERNRKVREETFWSFEAFVRSGQPHRNDIANRSWANDWTADCGSWADVDLMTRDGWEDGVQRALPIAEHALKTIDQEIDLPALETEYGMAGAVLDYGRFAAGIPECVVEYMPFKVSKVGKVVTLCSSFIYSAGVPAQTVIKRGAAVMGLAMALEESQHSVEIWIDHTSVRSRTEVTTKVLLKGANDSIDPARLAFQLCHPVILRKLMFAHEHNLPQPYYSDQGVGRGYGMPTNPRHNLPEGTIYLDCLHYDDDRTSDPERFVSDTLRDLGLID